MAAQINGQLEVGTPAALSFESISIPDLRQRWLDHNEHVRRSSLQTIRRYRAATEHLLNFVREVCPVRQASDFRPRHAEDFVRHLRGIQVAPNGHAHARKRTLRDAGIKFILETCSTLFNYVQRHRHLSPYAENPFRTIEISRVPIEDAKPIVIFTAEQERTFLEACDDWQFPLFLTLLLTGLRPGELVHLLLPDDLDLETGWLRVRNKPELGWQVKTRNERDIPLVPVLKDVLKRLVGGRHSGPVYRQRQYAGGYEPALAGLSRTSLIRELTQRNLAREVQSGAGLSRAEQSQTAKAVWLGAGALKTDMVRTEFMGLTAKMGHPEITAPKTFRHTFATILQDANVDPLIRNELMGHVPAGVAMPGAGLAMTAVYTHTRPETKRQQLENALANRIAVEYAKKWLETRLPAQLCRAVDGHCEDQKLDSVGTTQIY
jgi:integrase